MLKDLALYEQDDILKSHRIYAENSARSVPVLTFCAQNGRIPLIRTLVIRNANYPDGLVLQEVCRNSTKLTCLKISGYRIMYSIVLWLLELQIRRGRKI